MFSSLRDLTTGPVTMARKAFRGHGVAGEVLSLCSLGERLGIPIAKKATERCAWLAQEKERRGELAVIVISCRLLGSSSETWLALLSPKMAVNNVRPGLRPCLLGQNHSGNLGTVLSQN